LGALFFGVVAGDFYGVFGGFSAVARCFGGRFVVVRVVNVDGGWSLFRGGVCANFFQVFFGGRGWFGGLVEGEERTGNGNIESLRPSGFTPAFGRAVTPSAWLFSWG
jgi:hypothetical protein